MFDLISEKVRIPNAMGEFLSFSAIGVKAKQLAFGCAGRQTQGVIASNPWEEQKKIIIRFTAHSYAYPEDTDGLKPCLSLLSGYIFMK